MSRMYKCSNNPAHNLVGVMPKFCSECGGVVSSEKCACGNTLNDTQKFCERCGQRCKEKEEVQEGRAA